MSLLRQPQSFFAGIAEGYRQKRDLLVGGLREIEFAATPPQGAYYLFADYRDVLALAALSPTQAAMFLIEQVAVATVPGDNFYNTGREGERYCDSPSASRLRRWSQPSNGSVQSFASEWQSPDRLRARWQSPRGTRHAGRPPYLATRRRYLRRSMTSRGRSRDSVT